MSRVRRMDSGAAPAQYSQLLDCLCSWGQAADILELITDWLTESLPKKVLALCNAWHLCSLLCLSPEHKSLRLALNFLIKLMSWIRWPLDILLFHSSGIHLQRLPLTFDHFLTKFVLCLVCLWSLCAPLLSSFLSFHDRWRFNFLSRVFFLPTVTKSLLTALLGSLCTIVEIGTFHEKKVRFSILFNFFSLFLWSS